MIIYGFFSWTFWLVYMLVKFLLWVVGFFLFSLWWCQGQLLYLPSYGDRTGERRKLAYNPPGTKSPADIGLPFEDHHVTTKDGVQVHLWFIGQPEHSDKPTVIFFHGNAGNIGFRLYNAKNMYCTTGANVVLVEYRGYGNSTGYPSEKGLMLDAKAVLDWLTARPDIDSSKIFVFGRSLGGAVAMDLAANNQEKIRGVIVENTFTSIDEIVLVLAGRLGLKISPAPLKWFLYFFLTSHWKSKLKAEKLSIPVLFVSGLADELIPPEHMATLYSVASASSKDCHFYGVEGGCHNDTHLANPQEYYKKLSKFFADYSN